MSALAALAAEVRAGGGLLADAVREPEAPATLGELASCGPRAGGHEGQYALLVEAIHEGYLQHYGAPRVIATDDADLALLAGDRLYALGLARLAELGDLEAVRVLADVISAAAQAHAEGRGADAAQLWIDGARAVGGGSASSR